MAMRRRTVDDACTRMDGTNATGAGDLQRARSSPASRNVRLLATRGLAASVILLAAPSSAQAQTASAPVPSSTLTHPAAAPSSSAPVVNGFWLRNQTAVRLNPLGLFDEFRAGYRWRLFPATSLLFKTTFFSIGPIVTLSPAFARGGVAIEFQPLSVLHFAVVYEAGGHFGTFGLAQSFPSANTCRTGCTPGVPAAMPPNAGEGVPLPDNVFSDQEISRRGDAARSRPDERNFTALHHQLQLGVTFQIQLGGLIARSNNRFVYQSLQVRPGDRVFYDQYWDILFPNNGWIYVNDVDVLYNVIPNVLRVGFRYNLTHAFYTPEHFLPDERIESSPNSTTHRIGPLVSWVISERPSGMFNAPTLSLVLNWWLQHPYRTGGNVPGAIHQAIPYAGLAFGFRFDP